MPEDKKSRCHTDEIEEDPTASQADTAGANQGQRRRGGQPGNHNAYKHGFYSRYFTHIECRDLEVIKVEGLDDEIALIRIVARRLLELVNCAEDVDQVSGALDSLGIANLRLASLLKTRKILTGSSNTDVLKVLASALTAVRQELKI